MKFHFVIFLFLSLLWGNICRAQGVSAYNLNSHNGLPSDHVYGLITDRNGYLWIATDKGVVKYNGYECRLFSTADGLPTDDVWSLLEDLKGRIWLGCTSGEMGYIFNDKYYKANLKNINGTIFPIGFSRCDSGIIFSSLHINGNPLHTLCIMGNNDTIYPISFRDKRLKIPDSFKAPYNILIGLHNEIIDPGGNMTYSKISNINKLFSKPQDIRFNTFSYKPSLYPKAFYDEHIGFICGNYIVYFLANGVRKAILLRSHITPAEDTISLQHFGIDEPVEYAGYNNTIGNENTFFIFSRNKVVEFNVLNGLRHVYTHTAPYAPYNAAGKIMAISFIPRGFWGASIGTSTNGLYLEKKNDRFTPLPLDLDGCNSIGNINDSTSLWWSMNAKKLLFVSNGRVVREKLIRNGYTIFSCVRISPDSLLLAGSNAYYFNLKTDELTKILYFNNTLSLSPSAHPDSFYVVSKSAVASFYKDFIFGTGNNIDIDRYIGGMFDETRNTYWAYSSSKVLRAIGNNKKIFNKTEVIGPSTEKIEKLCIDKQYGNLFIKTTNQLYCIDPLSMKNTPIMGNINLKGTSINIHKDVLIIYGNFGIAFYKIMAKSSLSAPVIYYNTKKIHYSKVFSSAAANEKVTLLTDNGSFEISIPENIISLKPQNNDIQYNIIVYCNNKVKKYIPTQVDTIDQDIRKLTLDAINPMGNGKIAYFYRFTGTGAWQKSLTGEISIPQQFTPDNNYAISVFVMDDAWKSNVFSVPVYIKPYWWQTKSMRTIIWATSSLLILLIIAAIVLITRKLVLRASEKKNMQMELELKAIYAQINPHFIFNSLTSALLLISRNRMDEAYAHISKFSKLLRSYLKSSRNKYISIEDEIDNLKNYVELQQTRFKNRFTCNITIAPELNSSQVKIPSLLIQPFVENAINHGILNSDNRGELLIEFNYIEPTHKITCTISDNGIGRHQSRENKKDAENTLGSYGNLLINDLVNIFNRYEQMNIDIKYIDKELPQTGTSVIITISNPVMV